MQKLFYTQAGILTLIAVLYHYFGFTLGFFFTVWWWDILLHLLGGLWAALAGTWVLRFLGWTFPVFVQCVMLAILIGLGWEVFEYVLGIGYSPFMSQGLDTMKDVIDDTLGGVVAGLIAARFLSQ